MLTTDTNAGSFVKQNQQMAKDEGFASVSKKWYDKTVSYDDFMKKLADQRKEREDLLLKPSEIKIDNMEVVIHGSKYKPTQHCWKQMCNWLDVPQTMFNHYTTNKVVGKKGYNRDNQDSELLNQAFSLGLKRANKIQEDRVFMLRTYKDGTLRAWMTDSYACVDNEWYLEILGELFPNGRISHDRMSDCDNLYFNLLMPDSVRKYGDDDYGGMISCGNSEIGVRRFNQNPSIFAAICMNGCIWGQSKGEFLSMVHRGEIDLNELRDSIFNNINDSIPLVDAAVERFLKLKEKSLTKPSLALVKLCLDMKCSAKESNEIDRQFETYNDKSLFGLVDSMTRACQKFSSDRWLEFDLKAGEIMNWSDNQVERFNKQSEMLTKSEIEKFESQLLAV